MAKGYKIYEEIFTLTFVCQHGLFEKLDFCPVVIRLGRTGRSPYYLASEEKAHRDRYDASSYELQGVCTQKLIFQSVLIDTNMPVEFNSKVSLRCGNLWKCKAKLSHSNGFSDMIFFSVWNILNS